jgi:adenine-specific DNA-methyltransferase
MSKKDYSSLSKEQLIELVEKLDSKRRYGLVWEDDRIQEQVVVECREKLPILKEVKSKEIYKNDNVPTNILIEGDNFHALSVLNYTHKNSLKIIYLDPPYNTGKENEFMYNDRYVDSNDGYRHSKWLSFMSRRLELSKNLLTDDGVIFISIDDNEIAQLKILCNQIFGEDNFIAQFIRKNKAGAGHDSGQIAVEFDYMLCFAKNKTNVKFQKEVLDVENDSKYKLEDEFIGHRGKYYLRDLDYKGSYSESGDYPIITPDGNEIYSGGKFGRPNTWRWSKDKVQWGIENGYIVFKKNKDNWKVYIKQYQFVDNENNIRERTLPYRALISFLNSEGSQELNNVVNQTIFKFPKSVGLIEFCLNLFEDKNLTILDFFAGSGTTGHAVMSLNSKDNGNRKFILCTNNENEICEKVTYTRISNVINGYKNLKNEKIDGIDSNLKYFKTSFVNYNRNRDQLKIDLTRNCTEMLCLKENVFNLYKESEDYRIYKQNDKYMAVFYDFESPSLEELKDIMNKIEGEKILYCFTLDTELNRNNFRGWKNIKLEPIPQKILEVYKRIFNND